MINSTRSGDWCPWWSQWCFPGVCKVSPKSSKTWIWTLERFDTCWICRAASWLTSRDVHMSFPFPKDFNFHFPRRLLTSILLGAWASLYFRHELLMPNRDMKDDANFKAHWRAKTSEAWCLSPHIYNCGMVKFSAWKHLAFESISN